MTRASDSETSDDEGAPPEPSTAPESGATRGTAADAGSDRGAEARSGDAVLERELAFLIRLLESAQRRQSYPLERAHYLLLILLEAGGPQPVARLAARLALDDSTVTRQLAAMEQAGLLEKQPNPADRRSVLIRATARGIQAAEAMRAMRRERLALLFRSWDARERRTFGTLLTKFNASLSDYLLAD